MAKVLPPVDLQVIICDVLLVDSGEYRQVPCPPQVLIVPLPFLNQRGVIINQPIQLIVVVAVENAVFRLKEGVKCHFRLSWALKGWHIVMVHKEVQVRIIGRLVDCPIPELERIHLAAAVEHSIEDLSVHACTGVRLEAFSLFDMIFVHQTNKCLLIRSSWQPTFQLA